MMKVVVLSTEGRRPIEGASVTPIPSGEGITTNADGRGSLRAAGQGLLPIWVRKPGFLAVQTHARSGREVTIVLRPGFPVSGRILTWDGTPIPGATVRTWTAGGGSELGPAVTTGADGRYAFDAVLPGEPFVVVASVAGRTPARVGHSIKLRATISTSASQRTAPSWAR